MRIVLDTNLLVSRLIYDGLPRQLSNAAQAGAFELCTSEVLLAELLDVLGRAKFADPLRQAGLLPAAIVDDLRRLAYVVAPFAVPQVAQTDPDDDHVLAAALAANADLIASGDRRDLLPLGRSEGIAIVTARETLERLAV